MSGSANGSAQHHSLVRKRNSQPLLKPKVLKFRVATGLTRWTTKMLPMSDTGGHPNKDREGAAALKLLLLLLLLLVVFVFRVVPVTLTCAPRTLRGEMDQLFKAYLAISNDPEVGTNESGDRFWFRVSRRYNENRPDGTFERNESMVRNAIFRANEETQKFQGYYLQEERSAGSVRSELDIISAALATYQSQHYKPFKYLNAWQEVCAHPKYKGGVSSSSSKRSRWLASLPELTWVAPTPARAVPNVGRKEGNRRRPTAVAPLPLCHLNPPPTSCGPFWLNSIWPRRLTCLPSNLKHIRQ